MKPTDPACDAAARDALAALEAQLATTRQATRRLGNLVLVGALLLGANLAATIATRAEAGTDRRYTGVEQANLRAAFNANGTLLQGVMNDVEDIIAKLNSDGGVTYTNYAATNSGSTVDTLVGSN